MELLSRPRDSDPDIWLALLVSQRSLLGSDRVRQALDSSLAIRQISRAGRGKGSVGVTTLEQLFRFVISGLEWAEVSYMVVGSFASTYHGLPRATLDRRTPAELFGKRVYLATAEDTILSKLEWAKASSSERQLRDVAEILDCQGEELDFEYLERGLEELGLEEAFRQARGPW